MSRIDDVSQFIARGWAAQCAADKLSASARMGAEVIQASRDVVEAYYTAPAQLADAIKRLERLVGRP